MLSAGLPQEVTDHTCHPHGFNELATKLNSGMGSPDCNVSMVDIHLRKLLWVYCPGHAGVKGNDRADRLAGKAVLTSGLLQGRSELLRSLRHYQQAQSQGHHTIDHFEARGMERGNAQQSSLKGRERQSDKHWKGQSDKHWNCFKGNTGETSERRGEAHMGFSERTNTIVN